MTAAPTYVCNIQLTPTERAWKIVRDLARAAARRATCGLDYDDFVSLGRVALLESLARLDIERGQTFDAFALERIRGAMRDAVRAEVRSSGARAGEEGARAIVSTFLRDIADGQPDTHDVLRLEEALAALPEREALVVRAFDLDRRRMPDVALELGVTTPNAWRLRKRALKRLRRALEGSPRMDRCLEGGIPSATPTPRSRTAWRRESSASTKESASRGGTP